MHRYQDMGARQFGNRWLALYACVAVAALVGGAATARDNATTNVVIFGGSDSYPPYQWRDASGQAKGFVVDLVQAMATTGGRRVHHQLSNWPDALAALRTGSVDVVPMFATPKRAEHFAFTDPFYFLTHAIFGPPGYPGVDSPAALAGQRVAVVHGSYAERRLRRQFPAVELVPRPDIDSALQAVAAGEAGFILESQPVVARVIADLGLNIDQISRPLWPRAYVFAVRRDHTALLVWLQNSLTRVQASGRYNDIYDAWENQLEWQPETWRTTVRDGLWIIVPLALLLLLIIIWNRTLHRRVSRKTQALEQELERREVAEASLHFASTHEPLTQLPTRAEFCIRVDRLRRESGRDGHMTAIQLIHLEQTIAAFGHASCEQAITDYATHLQALQFEQVACISTGLFAAYSTTDQSCELVEPPLPKNAVIEPLVAVGTAADDADTECAMDATELLRRAETALWFSNHAHSHITHYDKALEPDPDDLILVRDFKHFGHADIEAVFQPQYNLASRRITALEALVRWTHPDIGPVSAGHLVPLLEHAGLTALLTKHMMDAAINMTRQCQRVGVPLPVSLNVSATDLFETNLPALLHARLQALGGNARLLSFEVTETSLIGDWQQAQRVMQSIRDLGSSWSLDDFGTGYSSLTLLSDLPLDEVKIDRSFVADMATDRRHHAIVHGIIKLARDLDLRVVAEGAEDENTLAALQAVGCNHAQGYALARPLSESEIIELLQQNR